MSLTAYRLSVVLILFVLLCLGFSSPTVRAQQTSQRTPQIRVDVDLVLVNVTVTDDQNRYVQGLGKEHFRIWEDKVEQEIAYFSTEDTPVTLGIILDKSGSMVGQGNPVPGLPTANIEWAKLSTLNCLKEGVLNNEYFLIEFSDRAEVVADFTMDPARLREQVMFLGAGGNTALWDAIYMGVTKMDKATYSRKALLVLTDGLNNHSRYSLSELKGLLREQDVRVYFFNEEVAQLAQLTGGRVFRRVDPCKELVADLQNQYVIGYRPTNRAANGNWRALQVRVDSARLPKGLSNLTVRTRAGYYAKTEADASGK